MAINIKIPVIQEKFSEDFLKEIEVSNFKKNLAAPKALCLFSAYDFEKLFNDIPAHFFILNIAKTHRVAIKIIQKIDQIKTEIDSAIKSDGNIDLLVLGAHGNDNFMQLSEKETYSVDDIKPSDFEGLCPNSEILLTSCKTGNGLAQRIADVTGHIVFAPKETMFIRRTSFIFCKRHGLYEMRSYDAKDHPIAFRFQKDKLPFLCNESSITYFYDLDDFLMEKSNLGDSEAQYNLGLIDEDACNISAAKQWYELAVKNGNLKAECRLGFLYHKEGNISEAKKWYQRPSENDDSAAQFNLGVIKEEEGNSAEAKDFFQKVAEKGNSVAQFRLGLLYDQERDIAKAKKCYQKAVELGNQDAQHNLRLLEEKEINAAAKKDDQKTSGQIDADAKLDC